MHALVIGWTGFVGRYTVRELLTHDYDVTTTSPDRHGFQFGEKSPVEQFTVDRTDRDALADAADRVDPDLRRRLRFLRGAFTR
jgi:nucleoside-diphosphate-sugar epimerase